MSDLDSMTDEEVANDLMKLNIRLSKANQLHAVDDAVMIQAVKRLNRGVKLMCKPKPEVECEVCGDMTDLSTSRYTRIGWVGEGCFPTYSIISDKERKALQATLQETIKSTIVAVFK